MRAGDRRRVPPAPALLVILCLAAVACRRQEGPPILGEVAGFALTERSGDGLTRDDLLGEVWIADFIFTRCTGPCPLMTTQMGLLQADLDPRVRLVSFTVDPDYDTPEVLRGYADHYGADEERWAFLTGDGEAIFSLAREGLKLAAEPAKGDEPIVHSLRFVLVDREGRIRGYYAANRSMDLEKIRVDAAALLAEGEGILPVKALPHLNASLNGASALFLLAGYVLIRRKRIDAHRACMLGAVAASTLFLVSYVYYHFHHGSTPFPGRGWVRPVYFSVLISHTVLAVVAVPLVLLTLFRALRGRFDKHKRIARWTLPLWLYISVTGVIIYVMLYHLYGGG